MNIAIVLLIAAAIAGTLLLQWRKAEIVRRADAARAVLIDRLVQRFDDGGDFRAFTATEEGRLLFGVRDPANAIAGRLLLMVQVALLLAAIGIGFLIVALSTPAHADINLIREAEEARYWATMCLAVSGGLAAAFLLCQSRARAWGLLPR